MHTYTGELKDLECSKRTIQAVCCCYFQLPQEYPGGLELGQKSFAESTANAHQDETRGATLDATSIPEAARRPR